MIHIIEECVYLEKIVRGQLSKEDAFVGEYTTYRLNNTAISLSRYLQAMHYDCRVYGVVGKSLSNYANEVDNFYPIEMNISNETRIRLMVDEEKYFEFQEGLQVLKLKESMLFSSVVSDFIHQDISVVIEDEYHNNEMNIYELHEAVKNKSSLLIGCIHPKYLQTYPKDFFDVLVVDYTSLLHNFNIQAHSTINQIMEFVSVHLAMLAKSVVVYVASNKIVASVNENVYAATYSVGDPVSGCYLDAVLAGVIKCYEEEGDVYVLLKEVLARSVGASLSSGLYVVNPKVLMDIKTKIKVLNFKEIEKKA